MIAQVLTIFESHLCLLPPPPPPQNLGANRDVTKTRNGERETSTGNRKTKNGDKTPLET